MNYIDRLEYAFWALPMLSIVFIAFLGLSELLGLTGFWLFKFLLIVFIIGIGFLIRWIEYPSSIKYKLDTVTM